MDYDGTIDSMIKINKMEELDFYHNIWQFRETMFLCEKPQKTSSGMVKILWVPHMCLCSFVCELEIKYICYFEKNIKYKDHNLEKLYEHLPNKLKEKIESVFFECNLDFKKLLHKYSKVFEQWRYKYEYNPILSFDKRFLKIFETILNEEIQNYRKFIGLN